MTKESELIHGLAGRGKSLAKAADVGEVRKKYGVGLREAVEIVRKDMGIVDYSGIEDREIILALCRHVSFLTDKVTELESRG